MEPIYKITNTVDGDADPLYVGAQNPETAKDLVALRLDMPINMLRCELVDRLPDGEVLFASDE